MSEAVGAGLPESVVGVDAAEKVGRFKVSVAEVNRLMPNVALKNGPTDTRGRPWRDGTTYVEASFVRDWIASVESRVMGRLPVIERIREGSRLMGLVVSAGHDVVLNGAGSYTYAAAGPEKAGLNDTTSYAEVLWRRYEEGLAALEESFKRWRREFPDDVDDVASVNGLPGSGVFPPPVFRDGMRW